MLGQERFEMIAQPVEKRDFWVGVVREFWESLAKYAAFRSFRAQSIETLR
jgi:hypothetical protein